MSENSLMKINEFGEYLDELKRLKKCAVIMAARDTIVTSPTKTNIKKEEYKKLQVLGLNQLKYDNIPNQFWSGYVALIANGETIYEKLDEQRGSVEYRTSINGTNIYILSSPYKKKDQASIVVDGQEIAVNQRGINIVVIDSENGSIIDSVVFDTWAEKINITRKSIKDYNEIQKVEQKHYDVGIFGLWYGRNYGSMITYFALDKVLKGMGYSTAMIKNPLGREGLDLEALPKSHSLRFASNHYEITPLYNLNEMVKLNRICDKFVLGSDQMWNYGLSKPYRQSYYFDFVEDGKKAISYATSFGKDTYNAPEEYANEVQKNLARFTAISVRDDFSKRICAENFGIRAEQVLDPVFLCPLEKYEELVQECTSKRQGFLFAYILDPRPEFGEELKKIAEKTGKDIVIIFNEGGNKADAKQKLALNYNNVEYWDEATLNEWLYCFKNADFVITDSFHGSVFASIFSNEFIVKKNFGRGGGRFDCLMDQLGLRNRMVEKISHISTLFEQVWLKDKIDYHEVQKRLQPEIDKSYKWFKEALELPKEKLPSVVLADKAVTTPEVENLEKDKIDRLHRNPDFVKIRILATLIKDYKVKHIVLSPGGRDVPIVRMFEYNEKEFVLHRVVDERSAAYYGLGLAAQLQEPVVCVCTSGTAASNYLPAVTEAYFTGVPLIMVTADRYEVYHGHGEDQTVPQRNIFAGVIKKEITVPEGDGYNVMYQTRRDISDCILETTHNGFGPVHINIGIGNISVGADVQREHWKVLPRINPHILRVGLNDDDEQLRKWVMEMKKNSKILIVYGQNPPANERQIKNIERFAEKYNCVIITDFISNLDCKYSLKPYNMLQAISSKQFDEELAPQILITVGGKRLMNDPLTFKIRGCKRGIRHWSVTPDGKIKDFYFKLTSVLEMSQDKFFEWFADNAGDIKNNNEYYKKWKALIKQYPVPVIKGFNSNFVQRHFLPAIPPNSMLHLGVGQSFYDCRKYELDKSVNIFCNMGTNGIDGCTSTFMGQCAVAKEHLCFLMVGDLSFFYDMNSVWNKPLKNNMRILLVNNRGSGLLRSNNLRAITSKHNASAKGWVENCGFKYISADNAKDYEKLLKWFVSEEPNVPLFFEVFCQ